MTQSTDLSGILQVQAYRVLRQAVTSDLRQFSLNTTQWFILGQIYRTGALRPADAASLLAVEPPTITNLSDSLVALGLIDKVASSDDKRAKLLILTPRGELLIPRVEKSLRTVLHKLLQGTPNKDFRAYSRVLETIIRNEQRYA
jgi:MarR family transcriptional regulator for hemolysin